MAELNSDLAFDGGLSRAIYTRLVQAVESGDLSGKVLRQIRQEVLEGGGEIFYIGLGPYADFADDTIDPQERCFGYLFNQLLDANPDQKQEMINGIAMLVDLPTWNGTEAWAMRGFGLVGELMRQKPQIATKLIVEDWWRLPSSEVSDLLLGGQHTAQIAEFAQNLKAYDLAELLTHLNPSDSSHFSRLAILAMCYPTSLLLSALLDFPWQIDEKQKDYVVEKVVEFRSRMDSEFKRRWEYISTSYGALSPFQRLRHPLLKWSHQGYQIHEENIQAADMNTWMTVNPVSGEPMQESEFNKSSPEAFLEWDHWMADIDEWRAQSGARILENVGSWITEADNSFTPFAGFTFWGMRSWALPTLLEYPGFVVFLNPLLNSWKLAGVLGCMIDGVISHVVDWVYPVSKKEDFLEEFKPLLGKYLVDPDTMRKDNTHQLQPVYPFGTLQLHLNCYPSLEDEIYRSIFARAVLDMEDKALLQFESGLFKSSDELSLSQSWQRGQLPLDCTAQQGEAYTSLDVLKLQTHPRVYSSRPIEVFLCQF